MSVHRETKRGGTVVYRFRWREGGGTAQPSRTFDLEDHARDFDRRILPRLGDVRLLAPERVSGTVPRLACALREQRR